MDMFEKPQVHLIDRLHQYGRELAVLKRMYQSYALIIDRILARQKPINPTTAVPSNTTGRHTKKLSQESNTATRLRDESPAVDGDISTLGAPLSSSATVRFERLRDRINLFALSEIQECLDEKESLVFLVCLHASASSTVILTHPPEFQSPDNERIPSRRTSQSYHDTSRQSHNPLHARVPHDGIFLYSTAGSDGCVHSQDILDLLWSGHGAESDFPGYLWPSQWDCGGKTDLSKLHANGDGDGEGQMEGEEGWKEGMRVHREISHQIVV